MYRLVALVCLSTGCKLFVDPTIDETCEDLGTCDDGTDGRPVDADGDGYTESEGDCDDGNADVNPGAAEVCDDVGVDEDCNGLADDDDPGVIGTQAVFEDVDGDGWGDVQVGVACTTGAGESLRGGDCDESAPAVNPGATEICDNGVDDDCDGTPGDCLPYEGALDRDRTPTARITSDAYRFGFWGTAGDLTGDGRTDLIVGSPDSSYTAGRAYVFSGLEPGQQREPGSAAAIIEGRSMTYIGAGAAVGDLDADGQDDLVLRSLDDQTRVFHGPLAGFIGLDDTTVRIDGIGGSATERTGLLLADVNRDGTPDVILGDMDAERPGGIGAVYVFDSPVANPVYGPDRASRILEGADDQRPGFEIGHGDFDGDGVLDLVTSDPVADTTSADAGSVWIIRDGLRSGVTSISDVPDSIDGRRPDGRVGSSFTAGDLDGDGLDDLIIGGPGSGDATLGQVFVFSGAPVGERIVADAPTTISAESRGGLFGYHLVVTDLSGDGQLDLAIAEPMADGEAGAVHLVYGPVDAPYLVSTDLDAVARPQSGDAFYGYGLTAPGDLDGEETGDLAISSADGVEVLFGGAW